MTKGHFWVELPLRPLCWNASLYETIHTKICFTWMFIFIQINFTNGFSYETFRFDNSEALGKTWLKKFITSKHCNIGPMIFKMETLALSKSRSDLKRWTRTKEKSRQPREVLFVLCHIHFVIFLDIWNCPKYSSSVLLLRPKISWSGKHWPNSKSNTYKRWIWQRLNIATHFVTHFRSYLV